MKADNAWKIYDEKMKQVLLNIADYMRNQEDFQVEIDPICEITDEEYGHGLSVKYDGMDIGIDFYMLEERIREGGGNGLAFGFSICGDGGYAIGSMTPYNYCPQLWVRTYDDLAQRFSYFEDHNVPEETCNVIIDWAKNHIGQLDLQL